MSPLPTGMFIEPGNGPMTSRPLQRVLRQAARSHVSYPAFFLLLLLSACSFSSQPEPAPAPRTSIVFLHYFNDYQNSDLLAATDLYNGQTKRYELKPVTVDHESFKTSIRKNLASAPADMYSYWAGARTAAVVEHLEPLDDIWAQNRLDRRFTPSLVKEACEYNGRKYLIPLTQHYIGFFYNKRIFTSLGLEPPRTWPEFLKLCARLKGAGITPVALGTKEKWPAQLWFDFLLLRTAPYEYRQQLMNGTAGFDSPPVTRVFRLWRQLIDNGYFNSDPNHLAWERGANEMVYSGRAAMTLMGSWLIGYFTDDSHRWVPGRDFDFFPFPVIDPGIPLVAVGPVDGMVIPRKAAHIQGAKDAMLFLTGTDAQKLMLRYGKGAFSANLTVPPESYDNLHQRILRHVMQCTHSTSSFELVTRRDVAELGINAFMEFLEFPAASGAVQRQLAADAALLFKSPRKERE